MPVKETMIQYPVGIEDLFITFMEGEQDKVDALPIYEENIYKQTNITKLGIAGNNSKFEKWASNQLIISVTRNTKYVLTFDLAGLAMFVKDKMEGVARKKGISFDKADPKTFPKFAIGVVFPLNDGAKVARWYPRCQLTPADESYQTLTDEMDIPDQQYVIEALPLLCNKNTKIDFNDSDETNSVSKVSVEDFMAQVVYDESQLDTLGATPSNRKGEGK